jgi:hypothetical protein
MSEEEILDRPEARIGEVEGEGRPNLLDLLAVDGIPQSCAQGWIRRRVFRFPSRFIQTIGGLVGLDCFRLEDELVEDIAQARCTPDVVDALHQHRKMRSAQFVYWRIHCPNEDDTLKHYWRLRARCRSRSRLLPRTAQQLAK